MDLQPIDPHSRLPLRDADAHAPHDAPSHHELRDRTDEETSRIAKLQRIFYADRRRALLVVFQGRNASGKDGTVRNVFGPVNPQGCQVTSFRAPSEIERRHDFLWRVHAAAPARGMIGVFNRSQYEDVLVPRVRAGMPAAEFRSRLEQINDFERMLAENGTVILKFFLHVSRAEQKARFEKRLAKPTKQWKFQALDLEDRANWKQYTAAYADLLTRCSTPWAPWYLVPADDKPYRNWLIARRVAETLAALDLRYPPGATDLGDIEVT